MTYAVIFNDTGNVQKEGYSPWGSVISQHDTLNAAQEAFRKRNLHMFDPEWAQKMGMKNAGTFDQIIILDDLGRVLGEETAW